MKELFKTIEYRSAQSKRSIALEVGDLGTVRWNGKTLTVRRLHSA